MQSMNPIRSEHLHLMFLNTNPLHLATLNHITLKEPSYSCLLIGKSGPSLSEIAQTGNKLFFFFAFTMIFVFSFIK